MYTPQLKIHLFKISDQNPTIKTFMGNMFPHLQESVGKVCWLYPTVRIVETSICSNHWKQKKHSHLGLQEKIIFLFLQVKDGSSHSLFLTHLSRTIFMRCQISVWLLISIRWVWLLNWHMLQWKRHIRTFLHFTCKAWNVLARKIIFFPTWVKKISLFEEYNAIYIS